MIRLSRLALALFFLAPYAHLNAQAKPAAPKPSATPKPATPRAAPASAPIADLTAELLDTMRIESFRAANQAAPEGQAWVRVRFTVTPKSMLMVFPADVQLSATGGKKFSAEGFYFTGDNYWHRYTDLAETVKRRPPLMSAGGWALAMFSGLGNPTTFAVYVREDSVRLEIAPEKQKAGFFFAVPKGERIFRLSIKGLPSVPVPLR